MGLSQLSRGLTIGVLVLTIPNCLSASHLALSGSDSRPEETDDCPSNAPAVWQKYLDAKVDELPPRKLSYPEQGQFYADILKKLMPCREKITNGQLSCLKRLYDFARSEMTQAYSTIAETLGVVDHELQDEWEKTPAEAVSLPREFMNGLPERLTSVAAQKGWVVASITSFLPDSNRTIIRFNEGQYQKWVLFASSSNDNHSPVLDIISLDTKTKKIYARERKIHPLGGGEFAADPGSKHGFGLGCRSCHVTGLLAIQPKFGSVDAKTLRNINFLNSDMMKSFAKGEKSYEWNAVHPAADLGPPRGEANGCTSCHGNNKKRGPLNFGTSPILLHKKLLGDYSMPPSKDGTQLQTTLTKAAFLPEAVRKKVRSGDLQSGDILEELRKANLISQFEYVRAIQIKKNLDTKNKEILEDLETEYIPELREWLKEKACLAE